METTEVVATQPQPFLLGHEPEEPIEFDKLVKIARQVARHIHKLDEDKRMFSHYFKANAKNIIALRAEFPPAGSHATREVAMDDGGDPVQVTWAGFVERVMHVDLSYLNKLLRSFEQPADAKPQAAPKKTARKPSLIMPEDPIGFGNMPTEELVTRLYDLQADNDELSSINAAYESELQELAEEKEKEEEEEETEPEEQIPASVDCREEVIQYFRSIKSKTALMHELQQVAKALGLTISVEA